MCIFEFYKAFGFVEFINFLQTICSQNEKIVEYLIIIELLFVLKSFSFNISDILEKLSSINTKNGGTIVPPCKLICYFAQAIACSFNFAAIEVSSQGTSKSILPI